MTLPSRMHSLLSQAAGSCRQLGRAQGHPIGCGPGREGKGKGRVALRCGPGGSSASGAGQPLRGQRPMAVKGSTTAPAAKFRKLQRSAAKSRQWQKIHVVALPVLEQSLACQSHETCVRGSPRVGLEDAVRCSPRVGLEDAVRGSPRVGLEDAVRFSVCAPQPFSGAPPWKRAKRRQRQQLPTCSKSQRCSRASERLRSSSRRSRGRQQGRRRRRRRRQCTCNHRRLK